MKARWLVTILCLILLSMAACSNNDRGIPTGGTTGGANGGTGGDTTGGTNAAAFAQPISLDAPAGGVQSVPSSVNDGGQVVGNAESGAGQAVHAVMWTLAGGQPTALPALAGAPADAFSAAHGNNNIDQVVGEAETAEGIFTAVVWDPAQGTVNEIPSLGGPFSFSSAFDINNTGQIVGESELNFFQPHAVVWTINATGAVSVPTDLGTLGGATSTALAVSDTGLVVGDAENVAGVRHAVLWKVSGASVVAGPIDLGTLPGHLYSSAACVNEFGKVVGESQPADGPPHAVYWTTNPATGTVTAGPVDLGADALANGINRNGMAVGKAAGKAVAWNLQSGTPENSIPILTGINQSQANSINNLGQVVGMDGFVAFAANPL